MGQRGQALFYWQSKAIAGAQLLLATEDAVQAGSEVILERRTYDVTRNGNQDLVGDGRLDASNGLLIKDVYAL